MIVGKLKKWGKENESRCMSNTSSEFDPCLKVAPQIQFYHYTCPICQSPLVIDQKTWCCDGTLNAKNTKHPFDVARQGYINLLPVQSKKSKNPGDSQDSILARQRFLQSGFYEPLQSAIADLVEEYAAVSRSINHNWLDIGCGEGYYSQKIALVKKISQLIAIDISKPAVMALAKSAKQNQQLWSQTFLQTSSQKPLQTSEADDTQKSSIMPIVASASHLPLANKSVQGVSSIFSPILPEELARVMADKGILLIAKPDTGHLASVRQALFDEVREHNSDKFLQQLSDFGFTLLHTQKVQNEFALNGEQLADLLTMTPYSYRAKREKRESLLANAAKQNFITQAKFVVYVLSKQN